MECTDFVFVNGARSNSVLIYTPGERQLYKYKSKYMNKSTGVHIKRFVCYESGCRASLSYHENNGKCFHNGTSQLHSIHGDQEERVKKFHMLRKVKDSVSKPKLQQNRVRLAFNEECQLDPAGAKLVDFANIQRHLRRLKTQSMPKQPKSPKDFLDVFSKADLMSEFGMCQSNAEERFYQTTVIEEKFSYTVFLSVPIARNIAEKVEPSERHYLMDATFSVVPSSEYKQLLIIYFGLQNHVFPFAFVLMTNKSAEAYEHIFLFIKSNILDLKPQSFLTDYEQSVRKALKKVFPEASLKGCWFHYCQALGRKASKLRELALMLRKNGDANRIFKKILALPLLCPADINEAFGICKLEAYSNIKLIDKKGENVFEQFFDYFEKQWLKKETFTVFGCNVRTTSALEGHNSYLSTLLPKRGSFWEFLKIIKQDENQKFHELEQALDGAINSLTKQKKRSKDQSYQIECLTNDLKSNKMGLKSFLMAITCEKNAIFNEKICDLQTELDSSEESQDEENHIQNDDMLCEICYKNAKNVFFQPCRHAKVCRECVHKLEQKHSEAGTLMLCPFCRTAIENSIDIFL